MYRWCTSRHSIRNVVYFQWENHFGTLEQRHVSTRRKYGCDNSFSRVTLLWSGSANSPPVSFLIDMSLKTWNLLQKGTMNIIREERFDVCDIATFDTKQVRDTGAHRIDCVAVGRSKPTNEADGVCRPRLCNKANEPFATSALTVFKFRCLSTLTDNTLPPFSATCLFLQLQPFIAATADALFKPRTVSATITLV